MTHPLALELLPFVILPNQNHSLALQLISFGLVPQTVANRFPLSISKVQEFQDLSWKTVKHIRTVFGTVFKAAEDADLVSENAVLKTRLPRRGPVPEKAAIQPEDIRKLLRNLPEPSRSIAGLLAFTGMRIGEVLALRWRDVDLASGNIRIRQTVYEGHFDEPKTKRSNRTVPLGPKGLAILSARKLEKPNPDALVFGTRKDTPLSRRNLLRRQLTPTCDALGLKGVNWHWLRHANATLLDSEIIGPNGPNFWKTPN